MNACACVTHFTHTHAHTHTNFFKSAVHSFPFKWKILITVLALKKKDVHLFDILDDF